MRAARSGLRRELPEVLEHLTAVGVDLDDFLPCWLSSLFVSTLSLETAARVWDCYLRDGEALVWQVVLWPSQDIRLLGGWCAGINHPFSPPVHLHCPSWCNTIARLMDSIRLPFRPPVCMLYTIQYW